MTEPAGSRWPLFFAIAGLLALALWLISPRFAIDAPSLVDDWSAVTRSPDQVAELVRLTNPEERRFRPSWIVWSYVQWHTFDAPGGLTGPNVWNALRVFVLICGLTLMTWLLLPRSRSRRLALLTAGLAVVPAFIVVAVPKFARDLAWFAPQEPLLVGSLALGGSGIALAAASLLDDAPVPRARTAALALGGALLWVFGVYHKEVALAAVPLVAAVLVAARGELARWSSLTERRRLALGALGAVVVLPLVHLAVETARIAARGERLYERDVQEGVGIVDGLRLLYEWAPEALPLPARQLVVATVALVLIAAVVRRRVDILAIGALASGALAMVYAAQSGVVASRYYIPFLACVAVALSLSLARLPSVFQAAGLLLVFFAFVPMTETRAEVERWSDETQKHAEIVRLVTDLESSGCTVAVGGLDAETAVALPALVSLGNESGTRPCDPGSRYLVLPPSPDSREPLWNACARGALHPLAVGELLGVYECTRLVGGPVRDPEAGLLPPGELIERHRLRV